MSENTRILSLPLIQGGQAQKHVTHNEALRRLDALVQPVAADADRTAPPDTPDEGDRHIVAIGATGAWQGRDGTLAVREDNAWAFIDPAPGWRVHVLSEGTDLIHDGAGWAAATGPASLPFLGLNAAADETNRLTIAAPATLLNHDGAGHQLKLNKAAPGETGSLLFQTGFSGRAEMGCAGDDDFSVKVSADGATWITAMVVDPATGTASFPAGLRQRHRQEIGGRWYCLPDNRWVGFSSSFGSNTDNYRENNGTGPEPDVNWDHLGPRIEAGTRISRLSGTIRSSSPQVSGFDIRVSFQHGPFDGSWSSNAATVRHPVHATDGIGIGTHWSRLDLDLGDFEAPADGHLLVFLRPIGTITDDRFIYSTLTLETIR